jgi:nucleotide-binding universal stress UspA family protein
MSKVMKTILIATDFSENSKAAARYGYELARLVKLNVILCNAIIVPAEVPQAGLVVWPMEEYDVLMKESETELNRFKAELEQAVPPEDFKPKVTCISEAGVVSEVVKTIASGHKIDMILIGVHAGKGLSQFILGNHVHSLIDNTPGPLLLVPPGAVFKPVKKIAFATEFKHPEHDLKTIYDLIAWAKMFNAEVLLTHITDKKVEPGALTKSLDDYLLDISNKADYPNIYYRFIKNERIEDGLDWLCQHGQVDMLAMVHQPHNLFAELFKGSHTKKMAGQIHLPLLVFPAAAI